jgi:type II secretory pathway component PulL
MRYTVLNYIELQIQYNQKMEDIWARLIPDLERIQLNTTSQHQQHQDDEGKDDGNHDIIPHGNNISTSTKSPVVGCP